MPVGRCDDDARPGGRDPRRVPEKSGTSAGGQQPGAAQPAVAAAEQRQPHPRGDERQPGRMHGRNGGTQQRHQVLRAERRVLAGRSGTSCHAVILRSRGVASDRIRDAGQFFGDLPQPVLQVLVMGLRTGGDQLRVATLLAQTVGAVVLAAFDVRVGGGSQGGQGAHRRVLKQHWACEREQRV